MKLTVFAVALLLILGCSDEAPAPPRPPTPAVSSGGEPAAPRPDACFSASAGDNSPSTSALFDARDLQGGGYTWRPLLEAFLARHATVLGPYVGDGQALPGFGDALRVRRDDRTIWVVLDEEGDNAIFCSEDAALVALVRDEHARANADATTLAEAIDEREGAIE